MAIDKDLVTSTLVAVLREGIEGGQEWSSFTDKGASLLDVLGKLSASDASRAVGGSSIAAHAHHLAFSLKACAAWISGDRSAPDWNESWRVASVDDKAWSSLIERLRTEHQDVRTVIEEHGTTSAEAFGGSVGAIAHVAYHLGAIRQKAAQLGG